MVKSHFVISVDDDSFFAVGAKRVKKSKKEKNLVIALLCLLIFTTLWEFEPPGVRNFFFTAESKTSLMGTFLNDPRPSFSSHLEEKGYSQ